MTSFPTLSKQTWPHELVAGELNSFYGNPVGVDGNVNPAWESQNLVQISPPWAMNEDGTSVTHITIHKKAADSLLRILNAVWVFVGQDKAKIDVAHLNEWGGSYNFRVNVNNPTKLSVHAYAAAFDIAPNENPNGKAWVDNGTMLPRWFIDACLAEGWSWGGDFNGTKDPMHFQATFNTKADAVVTSATAMQPTQTPMQATGDLLAELRQFIMDRTGLVDEIEAFKLDLLKDVTALGNKIQAFTIQPAPIVAIPPPTITLPSVAVVFTNITATVFGGASDPNTSAYDNHVITDSELGCALPFRFTGTRPKVRVSVGNLSVICDIVDVGPWNINDPYWLTNNRPQAESGTDATGRRTNKAGIDLTPAAAAALGIDGKGVVSWNFVQATQQTGASMATPTTVNVPVQSALASKINWTQIVQIAATLLTVFTGGKLNLSSDVQVAIVGFIGTFFPLITMAFRTFGTASVTPQSLP